MNDKTRKIWKRLWLLTAGVFMLAIAVCGGFLWYLPHRWQQVLSDGYLMKNQSRFRIEQLRPGNFNSLILQNLELGKSNEILFKAPAAEAKLDFKFSGSMDVPSFKYLLLDEVPLNLSSSNGVIKLNSIPLERFIQALQELPDAPDGRTIPLQLNALLSIGKSEPGSYLKLSITLDNDNKSLVCHGKWGNIHNPTIQGSWQAHIDLEDKQLSIQVNDYLTLEFFQEFLLRAQTPSPLIALLKKGFLRGHGTLTATYPELQITDFSYQGEICEPSLQWYKYKLGEVSNFPIKITISQRRSEFSVPELLLQKPAQLQLKDINLTKERSSNDLAFSASCNLQQGAVNFCCRAMAFPELSINSVDGTVSGSWNLRNHNWNLTGQSINDPLNNANSGKRMLLQSASGESAKTLYFVSDKFNFQAQGVRDSGRFQQELAFHELEFKNETGTFQVDRGTVFASAVFGQSPLSDADTWEFNFNKFIADTRWGQLELPNWAGEINLRNITGRQKELYLISRSEGGSWFSEAHKLNLKPWQLTANLEPDGATGAWNIHAWDFSTPQLELNCNKLPLRCTGLSLRGSAGLSDGLSVNKAQVRLLSDSLSANQAAFNKLSIAVDFDKKRSPEKMYDVNLSCQQATLPENITGIRKAVGGNLKFQSADWKKFPAFLQFDADELVVKRGWFSGHFVDSIWKFDQLPNNLWKCLLQFKTLAAESTGHFPSSGSFSSSSLNFDITSTRNLPLLQWDKLQVSGTLGQPAWRCGQLHIGGEKMQMNMLCEMTSSPDMQGEIQISNASLLGKYFAAMTPQLSSSFHSQSKHGMAGKMNFSPGSITSPDGNLELKEASFELPWLIADKKPEKTEPGILRSSGLYWNGQNEGEISAQLNHYMSTGAFNSSFEHTLEMSGELLLKKFANTPLKIQSICSLSPALPAIKWQWQLPESDLKEPLELKNYLPLPLDTVILKGAFSGQGTAQTDDTKPLHSQWQINMINADWQLGPVTAANASSSFAFSINDNKLELPLHHAAIGKLFWKDIILQDNDIQLSLSHQNKLFIPTWNGNFLGGTFQLAQAVTMPLPLQKQDVVKTKLTMEQLPADKFFPLIKLNCIKSEALLSGTLQLLLQNSSIYLGESILQANTPTGKLLQITPPTPETVRILDPQYRAFAMAVLKAMKSYSSTFQIQSDPQEISVHIKAEGVPAEPVPFVYQGSRSGSPFRPAAPGEHGFDGELELNVNLKMHPASTGI